MKRCRYSKCRAKFEPKFRSTEECCSTEHAIAYARESTPKRREIVQRRIANAERRERREKLKRLPDYIAAAQSEFNRFIRERDFSDGCISCHMPFNYSGQWHAGHYRTTAAASQLRFNEDNVNKQCSQCNARKSGNVVEYRIRLVHKIGVARVEALENDNRTVKWDRFVLIGIRKEYAAKWKALRAARESRQAA